MSRCDRVSFVNPRMQCDRKATATGRCPKHSEPMHADKAAFDPNEAPGADGYTSATRPDWTKECENCGETPVVPLNGLCGPCCFGEAETIGGNW